MNITIEPGCAAGYIMAPSSKSMAHRLLVCAGLCQGVSHIRCMDFNADVLATIACLRALGVVCQVDGDTVTVHGVDMKRAKPQDILDCHESGSTLRFFIPLALLSGETVRFTGTEKLLSRPLGVYAQLCARHGFTYEKNPHFLEIRGKLSAETFTVPGDISSQFITGLLLALPLLEGDSVIAITPPVESRGYIDLTLQVMEMFGVHADWKDETTLVIPGGQTYRATDADVEGDYSAASFFAALDALGGDIDIGGLFPDSLQGDKVYMAHFQSLCEGCPTIDIANCPDLGPVLFAVAAAKNGGYFTGTHRLRIKESDRSASMAAELAAFGTEVTVGENTVQIVPKEFHRPAVTLHGHNDHRIVMALAVLLTLTGGTIEGAEAVSKSFPDFFEKLQSLGIKLHIDNVGH